MRRVGEVLRGLVHGEREFFAADAVPRRLQLALRQRAVLNVFDGLDAHDLHVAVLVVVHLEPQVAAEAQQRLRAHVLRQEARNRVGRHARVPPREDLVELDRAVAVRIELPQHRQGALPPDGLQLAHRQRSPAVLVELLKAELNAKEVLE